MYNVQSGLFNNFYLRRLVRHFSHPAERQDIAVALGVVVLLEMQMHGCDAIGFPSAGPSIYRTPAPFPAVPTPCLAVGFHVASSASILAPCTLLRFADGSVIDNRITLTRQRVRTRPAFRDEPSCDHPRDLKIRAILFRELCVPRGWNARRAHRAIFCSRDVTQRRILHSGHTIGRNHRRNIV